MTSTIIMMIFRTSQQQQQQQQRHLMISLTDVIKSSVKKRAAQLLWSDFMFPKAMLFMFMHFLRVRRAVLSGIAGES